MIERKIPLITQCSRSPRNFDSSHREISQTCIVQVGKYRFRTFVVNCGGFSDQCEHPEHFIPENGRPFNEVQFPEKKNNHKKNGYGDRHNGNENIKPEELTAYERIVTSKSC